MKKSNKRVAWFDLKRRTDRPSPAHAPSTEGRRKIEEAARNIARLRAYYQKRKEINRYV